MEHELKTLPQYYGAVLSGRKNFEIRKNDRGFRVGDTVRLREYENDEYTGRELVRKITYVLHGPLYGLAEGWCILALAQAASGGRASRSEVGGAAAE